MMIENNKELIELFYSSVDLKWERSTSDEENCFISNDINGFKFKIDEKGMLYLYDTNRYIHFKIKKFRLIYIIPLDRKMLSAYKKIRRKVINKEKEEERSSEDIYVNRVIKNISSDPSIKINLRKNKIDKIKNKK